MTLDAKAFNEMRAKFNERVRSYAISAGAHAAFTLANYIAFDLLRPTKQSNFISHEELAKAVNMGVRTVQRLLAELVPLGLVVEPGNGRGKASVYRIGPAKGVTDDTLSQVGNHATGDTLSDEKGDIQRQERAPSDDKKGVTGDAALTRRKIQEERPNERERADARSTPSPGPKDFQNCEVKDGEVLPPQKATGPGNGRTAKATPLPPGWQPTDEDWDYASRECGLTADEIDSEVARFRDWCAEKGTRSFDWSASWRRFVGNSRQHRRNKRRSRGDTARELAAEAEAIEAAMVAAGGDPTDQAAWQRFKAEFRAHNPRPYRAQTLAGRAAERVAEFEAEEMLASRRAQARGPPE
jgi:hypothetical protein